MSSISVAKPTLPVLVSKGAKQIIDRFPINRIYCVGRNYREHAIEMGHDPDREHPFFFQKPADAIVDTYNITSTPIQIPYPPMTKSLHYEAELVVAIGKGGLNIKEQNALDHVYGYAIGCDLTRRDLQTEAKNMKRPWATAKGFDNSAPCGPIVILDKEDNIVSTTTKTTKYNDDDDAVLRDPFQFCSSLTCNSKISLTVNDENVPRQDSTLDKMVWTIPEMISYLSKYFRLQPGDLLMTGTPAGVGSIDIGDSISVSCGELPSCDFVICEQETS